jgi:N-dimethylarginine dimethylaminohydrolase
VDYVKDIQMKGNEMAEKVYVSNATNPLKKVMVCSPKYYKFNAINAITADWMNKGDTEHNEVMVKEWQTLVDAYKENGIEVVEVEAKPEFQVMTFSRDYGAMVKEGAIMGHFRHPVRQVEAVAYEQKLKEMGVPIIARCNAGCFEGGDFWMIDEHTLAFGMCDRTDEAGVANLRDQLSKFGYTVVGVPCPPYNLHLDMIFNIVAPQVALACLDELPYNFIQMLKRRHFELIPVASEDMYKHGCNVECIGNNKVIAIEKNKHINDKMRALGIDVIDVPFDQILHAGGGPHCLTQPIERP